MTRIAPAPRGIGFDAAPLGRAAFTAFLHRKAATWREVIASGNIRADQFARTVAARAGVTRA